MRKRAARILLAVRLRVPFDGELKRRTECAGIPPGHDGPDRDAVHAGQLGHAADHFLVEPASSLGARRYDIDGHVQREHVARVEAGRRRCSAMSVVSSMPAPASSTNDAAICVTANSRRRRFVPVVIRTLPLESPEPFDASAEGSRGTNASSTAEIIARPTPTHSTLASTVRSSARTEKRDAYRARTATIRRAIDHAEQRARAAEQQAFREQRPAERAGARRRAPRGWPSSLRRRTDRARIRFATLEHAMMKISADAASSTSSTVLADDVI